MTRKMTSLRSLATGSALLFLFAPTLYAAEQAAPEAPPVDARAWILMDYSSGKVLAEGNADEKLDPASLTKIMTSYVVGQALKAGKINLNDMVTVGKDAWATGNPALRGSSVMFLKPGDLPAHRALGDVQVFGGTGDLALRKLIFTVLQDSSQRGDFSILTNCGESRVVT